MTDQGSFDPTGDIWGTGPRQRASAAATVNASEMVGVPEIDTSPDVFAYPRSARSTLLPAGSVSRFSPSNINVRSAWLWLAVGFGAAVLVGGAFLIRLAAAETDEEKQKIVIQAAIAFFVTGGIVIGGSKVFIKWHF